MINLLIIAIIISINLIALALSYIGLKYSILDALFNHYRRHKQAEFQRICNYAEQNHQNGTEIVSKLLSSKASIIASYLQMLITITVFICTFKNIDSVIIANVGATVCVLLNNAYYYQRKHKHLKRILSKF